MKLLKRFMLGFFVLCIMFLSNNTAKATVGSGFKQVVAGQGWSMALNNDGHVWVWGNRIHGAGDVAISEAEKAVPRQVYGLDNVKALLDDKGQYALKNDGTVWKIPMHTVKNTYKVFSSGEIDNAKRIVDNNTISFAVKEDGSVYTWSTNYERESDKEIVSKPKKISILNNVEDLKISNNWLMILKKDKTVWMWNNYGNALIEDGSDTYKNQIKKVNNLQNITSIDTNGSFCLASDSYGYVYAWGSGCYLNNIISDESQPQKLQGLSGIVKVIVSSETNWSDSCYMAIQYSGKTAQKKIWGWGYNLFNVLGLSSSQDTHDKPVEIKLYNPSDVDLDLHAIALVDGEVYTWGFNRYGELGEGKDIGNGITKVEFKDNTTIDGAFDIQKDDNICGEISQQGQYRYYKFVPSTTQVFTIESKSDMDTYGYIYDASGNEIVKNDDGGKLCKSGNIRDFYIKQKLVAGKTYYIGIRCYSSTKLGKYELLIDYYDDYGNDKEQAKKISGDGSSLIKNNFIGEEWKIAGEINYAGDYDYFEFKPTKSGLYSFESVSTDDLVGYLYDAFSNKALLSNDDRSSDNSMKSESTNSRDFYLEQWLELGNTYYIAVKHYSSRYNETIPYTIHIKMRDEASNTNENAHYIVKDNHFEGSINYPGDIDFIEFKAYTSGIFALQTVSGIDTYGELYDSNMNKIGQNDDGNCGGESKNLRDFLITHWLDEGSNYYIKIRHFHSTGNSVGNYQFKYTLIDDFENDISSAKFPDFNGISVSRSCSFNYNGDIDVFAFIPQKDGAYSVSTKSSFDTYGIIYDSQGNIIVQDDNGRKNNVSNKESDKNYYMAAWLEKGKKYYIYTKEKNNEAGLYTLQMNYIKSDIGEKFSDALYTGGNEVYESAIDYTGDVDIIKIKPATTGMYTIESYSNINMKATLYDENGSYIATNDNDYNEIAASDNKYDFCIKRSLDSNKVYYVRLEMANKTQKGNYTIKIRRRFVHYINIYFDEAFAVRHSEKHNIEENLLITAVKLDKIFKKTVNCEMIINDPIQIESSADYCKKVLYGSVNKENIDMLCLDTIYKDKTNRYNIYHDFISKYPGSTNTTSALWTGHALWDNINGQDIEYNRSYSWYNEGIIMQEQGDDDEYYDRMLPCFVHEMAHQIYAPDHYHETIMVEDSDGKEVEKCLRLQDNGDNICSECGKTPRPQFCIMNSGWTLDSENGYFCDESIVNGVVQHNSGCISDMKKGLLATH